MPGYQKKPHLQRVSVAEVNLGMFLRIQKDRGLNKLLFNPPRCSVGEVLLSDGLFQYGHDSESGSNSNGIIESAKDLYFVHAGRMAAARTLPCLV